MTKICHMITPSSSARTWRLDSAAWNLCELSGPSGALGQTAQLHVTAGPRSGRRHVKTPLSRGTKRTTRSSVWGWRAKPEWGLSPSRGYPAISSLVQVTSIGPGGPSGRAAAPPVGQELRRGWETVALQRTVAGSAQIRGSTLTFTTRSWTALWGTATSSMRVRGPPGASAAPPAGWAGTAGPETATASRPGRWWTKAAASTAWILTTTTDNVDNASWRSALVSIELTSAGQTDSVFLVNGGWSKWESWSACSQNCIAYPADGKTVVTKARRTRRRWCISPPAAYGGRQCEKSKRYKWISHEKAERDTTDCVTELNKDGSREVTPWCPENCIFTPWGPWSACSETCIYGVGVSCVSQSPTSIFLYIGHRVRWIWKGQFKSEIPIW